MYIVTPRVTYTQNNVILMNGGIGNGVSYTPQPQVYYFTTKEQLEQFLKNSPGSYRIFEGEELDYTLSISLKPKEYIDTTTYLR